MGHGEVTLRNLASIASPSGHPARFKSQSRAPNRVACTLVLLGAVSLLGAIPGAAKQKKPQTRTVSGVVLDEAGNLIDGATVELTDLQTGKVLDIYSQEEGQYQFAGLRFDHDYTVKATYKNLSSETRQASSMDIRARLVLNLTVHKPDN